MLMPHLKLVNLCMTHVSLDKLFWNEKIQINPQFRMHIAQWQFWAFQDLCTIQNHRMLVITLVNMLTLYWYSNYWLKLDLHLLWQTQIYTVFDQNYVVDGRMHCKPCPNHFKYIHCQYLQILHMYTAFPKFLIWPAIV